MKTPLLAALAAAAAFAAIVAPAFGGGASVRVSDNKFAAKTIHVSRGATVTWHWSGASEAHNVKGKGFRSRLQTSGSFSHRFAGRGTYRYVCTEHADEGMTGTVVVR